MYTRQQLDSRLCFDSRFTDARIHRNLQSAVVVKQNMVRVWGGGTYLRDSFYDACDELDLIVWLIFSMGSLSSRHSAHLATWEEEVRQYIRRVFGHTSLLVYCGNNEGVKSLSHGYIYSLDPDVQATLEIDYSSLFDNVVRRVASEEDPFRHFHAATPSNGFRVQRAGLGMTHRWGDSFSTGYSDTRHNDNKIYCIDVSLYPKGRFVSEYGWQSFPSLSFSMVTDPSHDWDWNST